jgi:hypothetical protein
MCSVQTCYLLMRKMNSHECVTRLETSRSSSEVMSKHRPQLVPILPVGLARHVVKSPAHGHGNGRARAAIWGRAQAYTQGAAALLSAIRRPAPVLWALVRCTRGYSHRL